MTSINSQQYELLYYVIYDVILTTTTNFSEFVAREPVVESTTLEVTAVDRLSRNETTTTEFIVKSEKDLKVHSPVRPYRYRVCIIIS